MQGVERVVANLLALACTGALLDPATAQVAPRTVDATVTSAADAVMREYHVPGMAVAIVAGGKSRFYTYGVASRDTQRKVTPDTLFEIGSVSKTLTATLATYAQSKGRISLAQSPSIFFPELKGTPLDSVTLLDLATHTAGGFPLQLPDAIENDEQLMDYYRSWRPEFAPGAQRKYGNPGIGLLGLAVARGMGMSFDAAMEQQLFPVLGMHDSYVNVPASRMPLYAQGYNKADAPVRVNPGVIAAEAYGVKTSARDLIHFVDVNLDSSRAAKDVQRAIEETHTGYYALGAMTQDLNWEQYDDPVRLQTLLEGNSDKVSQQSNRVTMLDPPHPGRRAVWINKTGSTNGFAAYVAFLPAKDLGIVILANKNFPIESRIRMAYRILGRLGCCSTQEGKGPSGAAP